MSNFVKLLAASAATLTLAACASTTDLDDSMTVGVDDNDRFASNDPAGIDSLDDKFTVGCDDDDRFEAYGCDGIDSDGDGIDRDIYASDDERREFYTAYGVVVDEDYGFYANQNPSYIRDREVLGVVEFDNMTIADIVSADDRYSLFLAALQQTDLVDTFAGEGTYTVFAPTNAAFEAAVLDGANVKDILLSHVVDGRYLASDVLALATDGGITDVPTLGTTPLRVYRSGDTLKLMGADNVLIPISTVDQVGTNGVIHVIDGVVLPTKVVTTTM